VPAPGVDLGDQQRLSLARLTAVDQQPGVGLVSISSRAWASVSAR
jgi:hypothetical protein